MKKLWKKWKRFQFLAFLKIKKCNTIFDHDLIYKNSLSWTLSVGKPSSDDI